MGSRGARSGKRDVVRMALLGAMAYTMAWSTPGRAQPQHEPMMAEWSEKLDGGMLGRGDLATMQRTARNAPADLRSRYAALLARHEREYQGDPTAALRRLAPILLSAGTLAEWEKRLPPSMSGARPSLSAPAKAMPPWPSPYTWELAAGRAASTVEAAVEAARAWHDLDDPAQALAIVDVWGRSVAGDPRAAAAECAGDVLLATGRLSKALESYRLARDILHELSGRTEGLSPSQRRALGRVDRAIADAERRARMEKHGPGWVEYAEARTLAMRQNDPLRALRAYDRLAHEHAGTVYAEVAGCYGIRLLLDLSRPKHIARAREILSQTERELAALTGRVAEMRRAGVTPLRVARVEERLARDRAVLAELRAIPLGPSAEREALARAEVFLSARPRGLYRGETLLDLARWTLEIRIDPPTARKQYEAAWAWMEDIQRGEAALDAFEVPREAADVARAPAHAATAERMGGARVVQPEPGMVVNRRTCVWYLDAIRHETALALGFLSWLDGDVATAGAWYTRAEACDHRGRILADQGWAGASHRLRRALEFGRLHAEPDEIRRYNGRERAAVALAEFHYCADRPERVIELVDRLLAGEFGPSNAQKAQYPRLLRGLARHARGDRAGALEDLGLVMRGPWSITQDRAAFAAANLLWATNRQADAARLLDRLGSSGRSNDYVHRAQLALGLRLAAVGEDREAARWLSRVPPAAAGYYALARQQLEHLRPSAAASAPPRS